MKKSDIFVAENKNFTKCNFFLTLGQRFSKCDYNNQKKLKPE